MDNRFLTPLNFPAACAHGSVLSLTALAERERQRPSSASSLGPVEMFISPCARSFGGAFLFVMWRVYGACLQRVSTALWSHFTAHLSDDILHQCSCSELVRLFHPFLAVLSFFSFLIIVVLSLEGCFSDAFYFFTGITLVKFF